MSIRKKRAGRKSWATRQYFNETVGSFFEALGKKEWKYDAATTKAMIILRTAKGGGKEVINFSKAYAELSPWANLAFADISGNGLSDMLAETFLQGAVIGTAKAEYKLWERAAHTAQGTGAGR